LTPIRWQKRWQNGVRMPVFIGSSNKLSEFSAALTNSVCSANKYWIKELLRSMRRKPSKTATGFRPLPTGGHARI
jgi:hypothetical protein